MLGNIEGKIERGEGDDRGWGSNETVTDFLSLAPKSLQMVTAAMKLKDTYSLEGNLCPT